MQLELVLMQHLELVLVQRATLARRLYPASRERLAHLFEPGNRTGGKHTLVCVVLGILRPLLRGAVLPRLAPLRGAITADSGRKHSDSGPGDHPQPEGVQQHDRPALRDFLLRLKREPAAAVRRPRDKRWFTPVCNRVGTHQGARSLFCRESD